jgi:hypothetical protein
MMRLKKIIEQLISPENLTPQPSPHAWRGGVEQREAGVR